MNLISKFKEIKTGWKHQKTATNVLGEGKGEYISAHTQEAKELIGNIINGSKLEKVGHYIYILGHAGKTFEYSSFMIEYLLEHPDFRKDIEIQ